MNTPESDEIGATLREAERAAHHRMLEVREVAMSCQQRRAAAWAAYFEAAEVDTAATTRNTEAVDAWIAASRAIEKHSRGCRE